MICQRTSAARDGEFKTRAENGKRYIEGYFVVYGARYEIFKDATETVDRGAFDLVRDSDVRALTNHDTTLVLGRTTAGTLTLRDDDYGLWGSIEINENDQDAVNQWERVNRRDVTQCSFGFDILDEEFIEKDDDKTEWHIRKVKLYEVSVVTFPAYEATGVSARKAELETIKKRKLEKWRSEMRSKIGG